MLNITQNDYNIIKQRINERYIKINILDFQYRIVDQISGNLLSCSVQCDADSDLRRSCSVSLVVKDNSFDVQSGGKIWLDKYIQIYVGLKNIYTQEIQWYNQGVYLIDAPSWEYNAITNTLSFSGLDLMSKLTGARNGQLQGIPTVIKQGENVREAIIATLALGGFTKYVVSECMNRDGSVQAVPYDIEIDQGGFVYDILSALRDILPQYQIYFDVDGVFHYDLIPTGDDEPVMLTDDVWDSILVSESINTDFTSVKNLVEVYGYTHDPVYYPSDISTSILPDGYTQLKYICGTGDGSSDGAYINTNVTSGNGYSIRCKVALDDTSSQKTFFGVNASSNESFLYQVSGAFSAYLGGTYTPSFLEIVEGHVYDVEFIARIGQQEINIDGVNYFSGTSSTIADNNVLLFARSSPSNVQNCSKVKFYGKVEMFDNSWNKIRDFIPAKRNSDSAIGMYDLVSNTFFGNSGTGSFIAGETVEATSSVITMTIANLSALNENDVIGFTTPSAVSGDIQLSVNSFGAKNLVDSNGDFVTSLDADTYYVAMYQANDTWKFLGHQQAQATWSDMNPNSPFYVNGPVGIIRQVLCGGEYENIQSDELALERAKIEIYWKCRLNDSITLNVVPIPWLDVNIVVSHAPKDSTDEKRYIIKNYSVNYGEVDATMNVSMISYYGYYPMY